MEPITLMLIGAVVGLHILGKGATDVAYAVRGKDSPRWEARKAAIAAAAKNGGRPVRIGLGGYIADLIDDGFTAAKARHDAKLSSPRDTRNKPMRAYLGRRWEHRWENATIKHDRKHHQRQIKRGLIDPETRATGGLDEVFDTVPRDAPSFDANQVNEDVVHERKPGDTLPRPQFTGTASLSDVGIADLPDLHTVLEQAKGQSGPERELLLRQRARHEVELELMRRALASPIGQDRARDLSTFFREDWQDRIQRELKLQALDDPTYHDQVDARFDDLMHQADLSTDSTQENTMAQPNPSSGDDTAMDHGDPRDLRFTPDRDATDLLKHPSDRRPDEFMDWVKKTYPDSWQQRLDLVPEKTKSEWEHHRLEQRRVLDDAAGSSDEASGRLADVIPFNRILNHGKDTHMSTTASAELDGLEAAIAWANDTNNDATEMISDLETASVSLAEGGVTGKPLELLTEIGDLYDQLASLTSSLKTELEAQQEVTDAYNAVPDAGDKEFVTN
ncbi:hypothetical protein [Stackebrandtia nassauensis]|uniref:Uncharacterized protein n=1 Tax=Stackebrandtia nassauensis (strain DSM 44728 / CIP 108903 / NRRL B-16338 / NBRC 102104 / LLR-40K-21) TaxID=446470 RepID=D3Q2X6_STANL|nr:hypothetical protein [Stackebrandtia nassauensis]ADD45877.1 hypothetical protein Snas_6257 [Stackebrandtia nassauensis DSM 44728]